MQSDSLFYEIFATSPQVFFELIGTQPPQQGLYTLISQEVKQTRFQIDGVLLPHHRRADLPIYFLEVMGYKPKQGKHFYQELITEIHLYLNDYRPQNDWRAVVIYTQRSFDPGLPIQLSEYETGDRLQRLYLDRLPSDWAGRSLQVRAIQLMGAKKDKVEAQARSLIEQARAESHDDTTLKAVLQLVNTIFIYRFPELTRQEIETMLGTSELKQTRVYQDAYQDGELKIALLQLTQKLGELPQSLQDKIQALSSSQLEALAAALLNFNATPDLEVWLEHQS
jgi:predicted transposase/invertase (TIGR01784 family)